MDRKKVHVRETDDSDLNDILDVETQAFGYDKEAELVRQLLSDETAAPVVSLLAMHENEAVGHILFTKATIEGTAPTPLVYILAPLAVKPDFQKQGIGGILIREGLRKLKEIGVEMVMVNNARDDDQSEFRGTVDFTCTKCEGSFGEYTFVQEVSETGLFDIGFRIYPKHQMIPHRMDFPLVRWI